MRYWRRLAAVAAALVSVAVLSTGVARTETIKLDQGWSDDDRMRWAEASQGSRLIPLAWLKALEQADSEKPFLDDAFVDELRYLPRTTSAGERLPLGFAVDVSDDEPLTLTRLRWKTAQGSREPWVGLNCSACHTAEITYQGKRARIDGGPTIADFQRLMETLLEALKATSTEQSKWDRFAAKVLGTDDNPTNRTKLRGAFSQLVDWQQTVEAMNETPLRYGYARLDAFGHIFNRVALAAGSPTQGPNPSDAPVSYPFLWNVPQHERVQWNAIAPNKPFNSPLGDGVFDVGALGRNAGEVIGVFGDLVMKPSPGLGGYVSSVDVENLVSLERQLERLLPPAWPEAMFGPLDAGLLEQGRGLFFGRCASCHQPLDRTDLTTRIPAKMSLFSDPLNPPGTDPWMACNAYSYTAETGVMQGLPKSYFGGLSSDGAFEEEAPLSEMLAAAVAGVLVGKKGDVVKSASLAFFSVDRPPVIAWSAPKGLQVDRGALVAAVRSPEKQRRLDRCMSKPSQALGYKARPLTGIWATAPYLHNGSVATLWDLLLPPAERPKTFYVGAREYDPKFVGYRTEKSAENSFQFNVFDPFGRPIDGNSNLGHDYNNAGFTDAERMALIEYLKSL
jgi:mono/diheme cytochrome c family protein